MRYKQTKSVKDVTNSRKLNNHAVNEMSISRQVEDVVRRRPFLEEGLAQGILNYSKMAEIIKKEITTGVDNRQITVASITMALSRLAKKIQAKNSNRVSSNLERNDITVRSDLFEITVKKNEAIIRNLRRLYDIVDLASGAFLTVTHGMTEITIISNSRFLDPLFLLFQDNLVTEPIIDLSSISLKIPVEAVEAIGLFYVVTKSMAWENIPIIEMVSTLTELTLILHRDDIPRAFIILSGTQHPKPV